ncbi:MAG: putative bifunctional diguanylate cyclase/phosphodiesterase [Spirochaetales bacterium]
MHDPEQIEIQAEPVCPSRSSSETTVEIVDPSQISELQHEVERLRAAKAELEALLTINPATGLPIRRLFDRDLQRVLQEHAEGAKRTKVAVGVIRLDNDYNRIKHTRDRNRILLFKTADRIKELLGDVVYQSDRLDEFLVILSEVPNHDGLEIKAEEIIDIISRSHEPPADDVRFSCHVGLALCPDHGNSKELLLGNADIALIESEKTLTPFVVYDDQTGLRFRERERIEFELKQAIHTGFTGFSLHYQPLVGRDLTSMGAEALLRWESPSLGSVSPGRFVPIAEETGTIRHIGQWVLYQACRQLREWQERGHEKLYLSVNISPSQFKQIDIVERVSGVIESTGLDATSLHLELTETTVMEDPTDAAAKLEELRNLGIHLALDDFGTGYSSLTHLRQFPFDVLKIDRSFVTDVNENANNQEIVKAMIGLARGFGMNSLAEGVETQAELDFLLGAGCDLIQGYFFSRPLPGDRYFEYLQERLPATDVADVS